MISETPQQTPAPTFLHIRRPASSLNTYTDAQDISDIEAADALNVVFDRDYATPRGGSSLAWDVPSNETNNFLNLINCTTSARQEYALAIYAPNIYLRDETNNQWIKINGAYTPSATYKTLPYGNIVWNGGVGDDRVYFGNGQENTIKWIISLNFFASNGAAGDASITLTSAAQFPPSGTVIIKGNSGEFSATYTSKTGNVLNLTAPLGQAVGSGSAVTMAIQDMGSGIASSILNLTTASVDGTITLLDATNFANSGTVVINNAGSLVNLTYTSKSGNVLTLTGTVGYIILKGASVAFNNTAATVVPKGKLFAKFQGRLFIANATGTEATMWYSAVGNPENYAVSSTPSGAGFYGFIQGTGQVTGLFDFGQYLGVLKGDSMHRFEFILDAAQSQKLDQVTPLISDKEMGCPFVNAWVKKNNTIYYPSTTAGIFAIAPQVTGFQTSISVQVLSAKIQNLYQDLVFTNSRATTYQTKILWTCATKTAIDTILVYDILKNYWTRFNNWPAKDWLNHSGNLYFGSSSDNKIYKAFDPVQTDTNQSYLSYTLTKRFDFGAPSIPKTLTAVYVQGYMNTSTTLYCDVLFNEYGTLQKVTYKIIGGRAYVVQPITTALAMAMLGVPLLGSSDITSLSNQAVFKVYLGAPIRYSFFNIQFKFYSNDAAAVWSITGIGFNPRIDETIPSELVIGTAGEVQTTALQSNVYEIQLESGLGSLLQENLALISQQS